MCLSRFAKTDLQRLKMGHGIFAAVRIQTCDSHTSFLFLRLPVDGRRGTVPFLSLQSGGSQWMNLPGAPIGSQPSVCLFRFLFKLLKYRLAGAYAGTAVPAKAALPENPHVLHSIILFQFEALINKCIEAIWGCPIMKRIAAHHKRDSF